MQVLIRASGFGHRAIFEWQNPFMGKQTDQGKLIRESNLRKRACHHVFHNEIPLPSHSRSFPPQIPPHIPGELTSDQWLQHPTNGDCGS